MSSPNPINDGPSVSRSATLVTPALSPLESVLYSMLATPSDHPDYAAIIHQADRLERRIFNLAKKDLQK